MIPAATHVPAVVVDAPETDVPAGSSRLELVRCPFTFTLWHSAARHSLFSLLYASCAGGRFISVGYYSASPQTPRRFANIRRYLAAYQSKSETWYCHAFS